MNFLETFSTSSRPRDPHLCFRSFAKDKRSPSLGPICWTRVSQARSFLAATRPEERRPLRPAGPQRHRLGRAGSRDHGRRPDRSSALRAAGSRGTGRHDERLLSGADLLWRRSASRWHHAELAGRASAIFVQRNFRSAGSRRMAKPQLADSDPVTIIYTSGTSGEAKGVILTAGNVAHMLALHFGAARSSDGQQARAGPRLSLPAVLFRRFLDHAADLPVARQPAHAEYRSEQAGRRNACGRAGLFPQRPGFARAHAQSSRRTALEDGRHGPHYLHPRQGGVDAQAGRQGPALPTRFGWPWPTRWFFPPFAKR